MNKNLLIAIVVVLVLLGIAYWVVYAFTEPASSPPGGNVPAPINIGPASQSKAGDLESNNLVVREGLTLGGARRTSWPEAAAGCAWEGTRCHCASETASVGGINMTVGMTCAGGRLTDFKIVTFDISSRSRRCADAPPSGCSAGLYTKDDR